MVIKQAMDGGRAIWVWIGTTWSPWGTGFLSLSLLFDLFRTLSRYFSDFLSAAVRTEVCVVVDLRVTL